MTSGYGPRARAEIWDSGLATIRGYLREEGMLEVTTPWCTEEVAIEPYIEPVRAGDLCLITSPELWMKRLLCGGVGSSFQIAHVLRHGERGRLHAPEFHLAEWYRVLGTLADLQRDVERVVDAVASRVGAVVAEEPRRIERWERWDFFDLFEESTGMALFPDASSAQLRALTNGLGEQLSAGAISGEGPAAPAVAALWDWSALLSVWSDAALQPWLDKRRGVGVHVEDFPADLAALAVVRDGRARRSESYAFGVEIANGYEELGCHVEQKSRFERVNALRIHEGLAALPVPRRFLAALAAGEGLPDCAGIALGVDRLLMLAAGVESLADVQLTGSCLADT